MVRTTRYNVPSIVTDIGRVSLLFLFCIVLAIFSLIGVPFLYAIIFSTQFCFVPSPSRIFTWFALQKFINIFPTKFLIDFPFMSTMSVMSSLNFTSAKVNDLDQAIRSFSRAIFSSLLNLFPVSEDGLAGDDSGTVVWRTSGT